MYRTMEFSIQAVLNVFYVLKKSKEPLKDNAVLYNNSSHMTATFPPCKACLEFASLTQR